jgi:hypothetical protein
VSGVRAPESPTPVGKVLPPRGPHRARRTSVAFIRKISPNRRVLELSGVFVQSQSGDVTSEPVVLVALGDAAELTLGEGGSGSEDKRYEYN